MKTPDIKSLITVKEQSGTRRPGCGLLVPLAYAYIFIPVLIFALGWTKLYIGIPVAAFIIYGIRQACRGETAVMDTGCGREARVLTAAVIAVIVLWVLTSGIGASVVQYPDHLYRNAVYKILADNSWPVRMESSDGDVRGLVYYIGFWLPAALIAKFTSYEAGFVFQQIWAVCGLYLIWRFICEKQGRCRLWYLIVFIFFGGADFIGYLLSGRIYADVGNRIEWWAVAYNYPAFSTQLFWAFNQVIYGWLIYCLIDRQRHNGNILFIWSAGLITCPFPALGMVPFALLRGYENGDGGEQAENGAPERLRRGLADSCTPVNGAGLIVSLFSAGYVLSNMAFAATTGVSSLNNGISLSALEGGEEAAVSAVETMIRGTGETANGIQYVIAPEIAYSGAGASLWLWMLFCLLEFGLYFFVIYRSQGGKRVYWLCLAVLMICPLIKVGYGVDFCMRVSIPAMLCLFEMVISAAGDYFRDRKYLLLSMLVLLILIGSITTFDTLYGTVSQTIRAAADGEEFAAGIIDERAVMTVHNFSSGMDSFFYRHMAR